MGRSSVGKAGLSFVCPRCQEPSDGSFYGPCSDCRKELSETQYSVPNKYTLEKTEGSEYEPKMNVVPNQIATKE